MMSLMGALHQDRDKLLIVALVLFLLTLALHAIHHEMDGRILDWTLKTIDALIAVLLVLINAGRGQRSGDEK